MIYAATSSEQKYGGGFSFLANFKKAMGPLVTDDYDKADVYLIAGATMVSRQEVADAKRHGKKIVLRIDNAVRNSRNRNTGMSRMRDFAQWADAVIFQSRWARDYLSPFLDVNGDVIHNSVDQDVFHGTNHSLGHKYVYSRFNRDETKGWEMARYHFARAWQRDERSQLTIIGQFSPELLEANFDFYAGERYMFLGVQPPEAIADLLRSHRYFLYSYFSDACSNSLIEALLCGCEIVDVYGMLQTGGAPEIMTAFREQGPEYFHLPRMAAQYREVMEKVLE